MIPFAEEVLGINISSEPQIKEIANKHVSKQKLNKPFMDELVSLFDEDRFSSTDEERLLHSHGQTTSDEVYKVLYSKLDTFTDLVFYVESEEEAKTLIRLASKHNVCLIPFGGGIQVFQML